MNATLMADTDLEQEARRAARAHDSAAFAPLIDEILRRALPVDTTGLFNELWPPIGYGKYTAVRPWNHPSRRRK